MCHTGGPRCYEDAKASLVNARREYQKNPTPANEAALKEAKRDIVLTPEYISNLEHTDPEEADKLQKVYDRKLEGAKEYERYRSEATRTLTRLNSELTDSEYDIRKTEEEIAMWDSHIEYVNMDNENGGIYSDDDVAADERAAHVQGTMALEQKKQELLAKSGLIRQRMQTIETANEDNLRRRKAGLPLKHSHLMPEKFAGYFADTERKHFSADSAGSTFTEAKNLNEVLSLAAKQRKSLEGDDRDKLIARGADPSSFHADKRYLMVETKGKLGTVLASELNDNQQVTIVQKSEKAKPLCVVEVDKQKETDFATVVLLDNPSLPGTEKHPSLLITAFPGTSGPSGSNNDLLPHVGKTMTLREACKFYKGDFTLNTVVKS